MTLATTQAHAGYRHEALLWSGIEEFLAGTVPFVADGVEAGQPVMVAVLAERWRQLRAALGADAEGVFFADMAELGHNPGRIIPAWKSFVEEHGGTGQPVRGVGEPIWSGRRAAEISECQLHEALLNIALDPSIPLWLRCPYELDALDAAVIAEAHRSHPMVVDRDGYRGSTSYAGWTHIEDVFGADLPVIVGAAGLTLEFGPADLDRVRVEVARTAMGAGLAQDSSEDLALAAHEVAMNSLQHGGGSGRLQAWREPDAMICDVRDHGLIGDPLVGRREPSVEQARGRGLWMANQLCDLVQIRSGDHGTVVRLCSWL